MGVLDTVFGVRPSSAAIAPELRQASFPAVPATDVNRAVWLDAGIGTNLDAYGRNVVLFACVTFRSAAVAVAPARVYELDAAGDLAVVDPRKAGAAGALSRLLRNPNPAQSAFEFFALTQTMIDTAGFAVIEKARPKGNKTGAPLELWHLRPDWLSPIARDQAAAPDWEYRVPGHKPFEIKASEVIVVTGNDTPRRGMLGIPPVAVALREVGIDDAAIDFLKSFIDRGAVPQFALRFGERVGKLTDEQKEAIRESWQQSFSGWRSWLRPALLGGGVEEIVRVGMNLDEMAYPELRSLTATQICSAYRVQPVLIGAKPGLDKMTYSNYAEARLHFYQDVAPTLWARLDGALSRQLLPDFVDPALFEIQFDTDDIDALQEDRSQLFTRVNAVWTGGIVTRNEARRELGLPPLEPAIGDVLRTGLADIFEPAGIEAPRPAALTAGDDAPEPDPVADAPDEDDAEAPTDAVRSRAIRTARLGERLADARAITLRRRDGSTVRGRRLSPERRATKKQRSTAQIVALADLGEPEIGSFLRGQLRRIIGALNERSVVADLERRRTLAAAWGVVDRAPDEWRDLSELEFFDWDEEDRLLTERVARVHLRAGRTAFGDVGSEIGVDIAFDVSNPRIRNFVDRIGERVVGINERTRIDIARVVNDWMLGGDQGIAVGGIDGLKESLRGLYAETYRNRSRAIARTETQVAYNSANALAYRESGVVAAAELADNPEHTDDPGPDGLTCAERNGLIVDLDRADFHVEAEHPNGTLAVLPVLASRSGLGAEVP